MNTRMKLAIVLAGVAGVLLVTAGSYAYAQSTAQQSSQRNCGSMMNGAGGMGMMGGMNHYSSMNRCGSQMDQSSAGQCQDMMTSEVSTQPCRMMLGENATRTCY